MFASSAYTSTSTRARRRSGARVPFATHRMRTTHRPAPTLRRVPTTVPAAMPLAA